MSLLAFMSVYAVLKLPHADHSHWSAKIFRIDFVGALTLVSAVFLLLFGLDNGSNEGWGQRVTIVSLALAPVLFVVFVLVEANVAREPFAPGHVIFDPSLLAAYGANLFGVAGQMAVLFFVALFFQAATGLSATQSSLIFLPSTFFALSGSLGSGFVMKRTGRFYWLTLVGYCFLLLGIVPMVLGAGWQSVTIAGMGLTVLSFGSSICKFKSLIFYHLAAYYVQYLLKYMYVYIYIYYIYTNISKPTSHNDDTHRHHRQRGAGRCGRGSRLLLSLPVPRHDARHQHLNGDAAADAACEPGAGARRCGSRQGNRGAGSPESRLHPEARPGRGDHRAAVLRYRDAVGLRPRRGFLDSRYPVVALYPREEAR